MSRLVVLAALMIALAGGCVGFTTESQAPVDLTAPGSWSILAPMPTARQEVAVAALDGRVYVIGGFGPGFRPVATVEAYDAEANEWEPRASLPEPVHHAAAAVVNGRLFVIGGYTGGRLSWEASPTVYEYDLQGNTWKARAVMPTPRGALAVAVVANRIHALGGSGEKLSQAHEVYDPAADRWTAANLMPTGRDHLAAVAYQDRVWAIGGRTSFRGTQFANVEIYEPATDSWRTGSSLPSARGGLAAAVLRDRIFVFGGEAPFRIFNATEMYDPGSNRWIAKAAMPTARHGIGAVVVGGRIYVPGGARQPGFDATRANEAYTP
ncbi:MAG: Kelch repeat-containing protein [Candidatus Rokuibacteriota bacterium]